MNAFFATADPPLMVTDPPAVELVASVVREKVFAALNVCVTASPAKVVAPVAFGSVIVCEVVDEDASVVIIPVPLPLAENRRRFVVSVPS